VRHPQGRPRAVLLPESQLWALRGARDAGSLAICGHFGNRQHIRLLSCDACKARFSRNKGTAFLRSKLPTEKALAVLQHLAESNGFRQTP
jgi:hypothetical protein